FYSVNSRYWRVPGVAPARVTEPLRLEPWKKPLGIAAPQQLHELFRQSEIRKFIDRRFDRLGRVVRAKQDVVWRHELHHRCHGECEAGMRDIVVPLPQLRP